MNQFQIPELQKQNSASKQTKFVLVVGTNGTGKSTFAASLIDRAVTKKARALIVMPDDMEWQNVPFLQSDELESFTRVKKTIFGEETFADLLNYKRGLLLLDDCRAYVRSGLTDSLHELLIRRRQNDVSIIAVGHGFTEIPPKFFTFATEIVIFRTVDNILKRKDCIRDWPSMAFAVQHVNRMAQEGNPHYYRVIRMN